MKIYTRRGDAGETDLFGSGRVPKDHLRVEAYGAVDELNATLGLCVAATSEADLGALVQRLQCGLFELGAYLATPEARHREAMKMHEPSDAEIAALEARIDDVQARDYARLLRALAAAKPGEVTQAERMVESLFGSFR